MIAVSNRLTEKSPFTACLGRKADRFSVETDGRVWLETINKEPVLCVDVDAALFVEEAKNVGPNVRVMVDHLVPPEYSGTWRLGMQTQPEGHAVFTPYKQELPTLPI